MKTIFTLSSKIDKKTGRSEIYVRFTGGRNMQLRAKTGIYIKVKHWDDEFGRVKSVSRMTNKDEQKVVTKTNELVEGLRYNINTRFEEDQNKVTIDKEWLETVIKEYLDPDTRKTDISAMGFYDAFDQFVKMEGQLAQTPTKHWAYSTKQKFTTLRNHLISFDDSLAFEDITVEKLADFVTFEQNTLGLIDSTVKKHIVYLKWFLRWAVKMDITKNNDFEKFSTGIPTQETKVIFLTADELKKVKTHDFSDNPRMDRIRDVYIFCCYTGLRYSDVENLKKENIYDDMIHFTTIKTDDKLTIELNDVARAILDKYSGCKFKGNKALPVLPIQKMNEALKEMAEACEINSKVEIIHFKKGERVSEIIPKYKLITTHTARKTFVCTAIRLGINPVVIMKITGHKSYNTMKPYIDAEDKVRREAMDKFNTLE